MSYGEPPLPSGDRNWNEYHNSYNRGMSAFLGVLAGGILGLVAWIWIGAPGSPAIGAVVGAAVLFAASRWVDKRLERNFARRALAEKRALMEERDSETKRKIDAMRRANSRIPDVTRPARKGE